MAVALRRDVSSITAVHVRQDCGQALGVFDRVDFWNRNPARLAKLLHNHGTDVLWIQYSGYGFAYQGTPWYLNRAIDALVPRPRIVVFYHEIHCSPRHLGWKGFLVSPAQKRVAKALAKRADVVFTSLNLYAQIIREQYGVPRNKVVQLTLGSNISVPHFSGVEREAWRHDLQWRRNERVAVAFGAEGSQRRALLQNDESLLSAIEADVIHRIVCIGGSATVDRDNLLSCIHPRIARVTKVMGHQSEERVAKILVAADLALTAYPFERCGKSGVFMAYSLAGLPVIVDANAFARHDSFRGAQLVPGQHLAAHQTLLDDIDSRISRHRQATKAYSWASLARQALVHLKSGSNPPTTEASPVS